MESFIRMATTHIAINQGTTQYHSQKVTRVGCKSRLEWSGPTTNNYFIFHHSSTVTTTTPLSRTFYLLSRHWQLRYKIVESLDGVTTQERLCYPHLAFECGWQTTVLYKLKIGEDEIAIPNIGINAEQFDYRSIHFIGSQNMKRVKLRHYYQGLEGCIFVIDSTDSTDSNPIRLEETRRELSKLILEGDMQSVNSVLILADRQDLPHAMSASTLSERLDLACLFR